METPPANHAEEAGPGQGGELQASGRPGGSCLVARGQRRAAGAGQQLGGLGCSPRKGAGRAPAAHVTLPQASLSGFLGCNWSCPACEPPCQAEISERGKGEEGLDQVLPPAPSALCTARRGPGSSLAPLALSHLPLPLPLAPASFAGPKDPRPQPSRSPWAREAGLPHTVAQSRACHLLLPSQAVPHHGNQLQHLTLS